MQWTQQRLPPRASERLLAAARDAAHVAVESVDDESSFLPASSYGSPSRPSRRTGSVQMDEHTANHDSHALPGEVRGQGTQEIRGGKPIGLVSRPPDSPALRALARARGRSGLGLGLEPGQDGSFLDADHSESGSRGLPASFLGVTPARSPASSSMLGGTP